MGPTGLVIFHVEQCGILLKIVEFRLKNDDFMDKNTDPHGGGQENDTHCPYDHPPPETFAALEKVAICIKFDECCI